MFDFSAENLSASFPQALPRLSIDAAVVIKNCNNANVLIQDMHG